MKGARLRRRLRVNVDVSGALNLVGALLRYFSLAFVFPVVVALLHSETPVPFLAAMAITAVAGVGLGAVTQGREHVGVREGFLVVSLTWLLGAVAVSLPYVFSTEVQLDRPVDALFEAMSGMTTSGATVLVEYDTVDRSLMLWRQFSQWLGGMGIVVLALAVLPRLRVGGRQLMESETPGPDIDPLAATIRHTARRLWLLYVSLTAILAAILAIFGWTGIDPRMDFYEAVAYAFSTLPTGGFGTDARSAEIFAPASQWVLALFMLIGGVNFALLYAAFVRRRPRAVARDEELRLYLTIVVVASAVITYLLWDAGLFAGEAALRHAVFQTISVTTTTGLASTDYATWLPVIPAAALFLVMLMFSGASAGSTSGSVKVARHLVVGRVLRRELDQTMHAEYVSPIRLNRLPVDERATRAVIAFVIIYVGLFVAGTVALLADAHRSGLELTPFEALSAAASTLGNIGPAFGFAGPMGSFADFSPFAKSVMTVLMWMGRLEIVPVAILLTRRYWRA
jgi:trk system potassium uptake protein TrkH